MNTAGEEARNSRNHAVEEAYPAQALLFQKGEPADFFFLLKEGQVELFSPGDPEIQIALLGPGDSFGEQAILFGGVRSLSARALAPVVCVKMQADALRELLEGQPGILKPVIESLLLQLYMQNEFKASKAPYVL
jgi:CRP-like cAMP-binding protein